MVLSVCFCCWYGCHLGVVLLMALGGPLISASQHPRRSPLGQDLQSDKGSHQWRSDDLEAQSLLLSRLLSTLNLTENGAPRTGPGAGPGNTVDYMLELYKQFASDFRAVPSASIVRSFQNQDSSPSRVTAGGTWAHPLLFVISVPRHEQIRLAELRLHIAGRRTELAAHAATPHRITMYQVIQPVVSTGEALTGGRRRTGEEEVGWEMERLASKRIKVKGHQLVSFDLTQAVRTMRSSGYETQRLEVHVKKVLRSGEEKEEEEEEEVGASADVVVEREADGHHNAVIIVFSDDPASDRKPNQGDPRRNPTDREGLVPEGPPDLDQPAVWEGDHDDEGRPSGKHSGAQPHHQHHQQHRRHHQQQQSPSRTRTRRAATSTPCKRAPLYVDFKDIGWDQWVIQPLGYEAYECNGACSMPMTSEVSPTKHAVVQTLLSLQRPQKASRACCVPTRLDAIPLLYHDNGVVTFNYMYEGMVVAECGCR